MFKEFDNKTIEDIIINSKSFFKNVDENFYDGVQELIKVTYESLKEEGLFKIYRKYRYDELDEVMTYVKKHGDSLCIPNRKYIKPVNTPKETYNIIENFFNSFGKIYGECAHYFLKSTPLTITDRALNNEDYIYRFMLIEDNIILEDASDNMYTIEGNYLDVIIIAHEIAHQLTENAKNIKQIDLDEEREGNFINKSSFYETTAMYIELICADYVKEKFGYEEYAKWAMSIRGIELLEELKNKNNSTKLSTLSEWIKLIKKIGTAKDDIEKVKDFILNHDLIYNYQIGKEHMSSSMVIWHQHLLGYFYAVFLKRSHDNNKEFLDKERILNKCTKINSFGTEFENEQIEILKQLQLPIIRDDRIIMDEKAISTLSSVYLRYFRENLGSLSINKNTVDQTAIRRKFINSINECSNLNDKHSVKHIIKKENEEQNIDEDYER